MKAVYNIPRRVARNIESCPENVQGEEKSFLKNNVVASEDGWRLYKLTVKAAYHHHHLHNKPFFLKAFAALKPR